MAVIKKTDDVIRKAAEAAAAGAKQTAGQSQKQQTGTVQLQGVQPVQTVQPVQQNMGAQRSGYSYGGTRPAYTSPYGDQIDELLSGILNREGFSYDVDSDPLYQQYRAQYTREGDRAMRDAMGQAAAMTGGYGSSYATTAATQANDYYMSQLNDRIPELEQLAYAKYVQEGQDLLSQLAALQGAEQAAYGRYRDQVGDYESDRSFDYGLWADALSQENWQTSFDYQKAQDALSQENWQKTFDYQQAQDALAQQNWEREFAYQQQQDALAYALQQAKLYGSGGGNGGGTGGGPGNATYQSSPYTATGQRKSRAMTSMSSLQRNGATGQQMAAQLLRMADLYSFSEDEVFEVAQDYGIVDEVISLADSMAETEEKYAGSAKSGGGRNTRMTR